MAHNSAVGMVAEGRWYGLQFLEQMMEHVPDMADELGKAILCYLAQHDLMWKIHGLRVLSEAENYLQNLADPGIRRQAADFLRQARDLDVKALDHLQKALTKM